MGGRNSYLRRNENRLSVAGEALTSGEELSKKTLRKCGFCGEGVGKFVSVGTGKDEALLSTVKFKPIPLFVLSLLSPGMQEEVGSERERKAKNLGGNLTPVKHRDS